MGGALEAQPDTRNTARMDQRIARTTPASRRGIALIALPSIAIRLVGFKPRSSGIFVKRSRARWQLNPWMSTAIVDGNLGRGKGRVGKRTHGDANRFIFTN